MNTEQAITPGQYIQHHLEHLTLNLKTLTFNDATGSFWNINLDTMIVSIVLGALILGILRYVAVRMQEMPGRLQNAVEAVHEFINDSVHQVFHHKSDFVPSLAITIFLWTFMMNAMDLLPVDLVPRALGI